MKKLPPTIKDELKQLRDQQPSSAWKQATKQSLMSQLNLSPEKVAPKASAISDVVFIFIKDAVRQMSLKPVGVLLLIGAVIMGPGLVTVSAARASLPGDALYGVKRGLEQADIRLTFNNLKKAEKEIQVVGNRLGELQRLAQENAPTPQRKEKIVLALEELKKDTTVVKNRLAAAKPVNKEKPKQKNTDVARIIEDKASDLTGTLKAAVSSLEADSVGDVDEIEEALSEVQGVALDALVILAENQEQGDESITDEELQERFKDHIADVKETVNTISGKIQGLENEKKGESTSDIVLDEENQDVNENSLEDDKEEDDTEEEGEETVQNEEEAVSEEPEDEPSEDFTVVKESLKGEIQDDIQYVEELLEMDQFQAALDSLATTKGKVNNIQANVKQVGKVVADPVIVENSEDETKAEEVVEEDSTEDAEEVVEVPEIPVDVVEPGE